LIAAERSPIFADIEYAYDAMLFSTPFIGASRLLSIPLYSSLLALGFENEAARYATSVDLYARICSAKG